MPVSSALAGIVPFASGVSSTASTYLVFLPLICLAVYLGFMCYVLWRSRRGIESSPPRQSSGPRRRCRYCLFGVARLRDQTVRSEGNSLIRTRCFVCRQCGLPHWTVERSPLTERVR
jgi:hypothetical protein